MRSGLLRRRHEFGTLRFFHTGQPSRIPLQCHHELALGLARRCADARPGSAPEQYMQLFEMAELYCDKLKSGGLIASVTEEDD